MRKKKNGASRIAACASLLISEPTSLKSSPCSAFPEERRAFPLCLEIGCGKGSFACGLTAQQSDINLIAMERVADVACLALEKAMSCADTRPDNLRFIIGDARFLEEYFPEGSIDRLYLNFSDPWPKTGYAKRRLTYKTFLEIYRRLLKDGGELHFKTDNQGLFDFSLEQFAECGLEVLWQTRDLHASERAATNVITEYEAAFTAKGMPIYSAIVRFSKFDRSKQTEQTL